MFLKRHPNDLKLFTGEYNKYDKHDKHNIISRDTQTLWKNAFQYIDKSTHDACSDVEDIPDIVENLPAVVEPIVIPEVRRSD